MSLIDRIKQKKREWALSAVLAGSLFFGGCEGVQPGPLHPSKLLFGATTLDSEHQSDANWKPGPLHPSELLFGSTVLNNQNRPQQEANFNWSGPRGDVLREYHLKDGILYDKNTGNKMMNEYLISGKFVSPLEIGGEYNKTVSLVYLKIGEKYHPFGFVEYR